MTQVNEEALAERTLVEQFEACTLPREFWTHEAHLTVARAYLVEEPLHLALARFRRALRRYNETIGIPESLTMGYHESMTEAWFRILDAIIRSRGAEDSIEAFFAEHPYLRHKKLMRLFYTSPRMISLRAKHQWVEPDVLPLDRPAP